MAKVRINGEYFEHDRSKRPLHEMIALEKALGVNYAQWQDDMAAGSARALAGLIWLVWRRNGRDVPFADIESGAVEIDYEDFAIEADVEPDPTQPGDSSSTGGGTSQPSASSASARGKSASST